MMRKVQVEYDTDPAVPEQGYRFMHCGRCLDEKPADVTPHDWARQQMSITEEGHFQLWCNRHDCNIALMKLKVKSKTVGREGQSK